MLVGCGRKDNLQVQKAHACQYVWPFAYFSDCKYAMYACYFLCSVFSYTLTHLATLFIRCTIYIFINKFSLFIRCRVYIFITKLFLQKHRRSSHQFTTSYFLIQLHRLTTTYRRFTKQFFLPLFPWRPFQWLSEVDIDCSESINAT